MTSLISRKIKVVQVIRFLKGTFLRRKKKKNKVAFLASMDLEKAYDKVDS